MALQRDWTITFQHNTYEHDLQEDFTQNLNYNRSTGPDILFVAPITVVSEHGYTRVAWVEDFPSILIKCNTSY